MMPKSPHSVPSGSRSPPLIGYVNGIAYQTIQSSGACSSLFPLRYAESCLEIQHNIFAANNFAEYSLQSQIKRFIDQMSFNRPNGIVCIDYDGTIINSHIPITLHSRYNYAKHYNLSQEGWRNAVLALKEKGYDILLLTDRVPLIGEDDVVFQAIVNGDFKNLFTEKIFVSRVMPKGLLMYYLAEKIKLPVSNWVLIDNDDKQIKDAQRYEFQSISFAREHVSLQSRVAATLLDQLKFPFGAQLARQAGTTQLRIVENDPWVFEQMAQLKEVGRPIVRSPLRTRSPSPGSPFVIPEERASPTFFLPSPVRTPTYSELPLPSTFHPI